MVVATMPWLPSSIKSNTYTLQFFSQDKSSSPAATNTTTAAAAAATLQILAFETAKAMSSLVSLYRSLSDEEISKLRRETVKSEGVCYLNSRNEQFLLNLAYEERLEDLNIAASSVSRLTRKCSDLGLSRFDLVFSDMKLGIFNPGKFDFGSRNVSKLVGRIEKLVCSTAELHSAMEDVVEMEIMEKKLQKWRTFNPKHCPPVNFDLFDKDITSRRKDVKHFKEISLWSQTFDYTVGLMSRLVYIIYARIYIVFRPFIQERKTPADQIHTHTHHNNNYNQIRIIRDQIWSWSLNSVHRKFHDNELKLVSKSVPVLKSSKKELVRFPSGLRNSDEIGIGYGGEFTTTEKVYGLAPPTTVGGSGLSIHYANVILLAERCLHAPATIGEDSRAGLYGMLPSKIKEKVRAKLKRNNWVKRGEEETASDDGHSLAEGWRVAVEEMMGWLGPLAHDTVRWRSERSFEKQRFDTNPTVLLMQTLHYSNLEKTEAAIVEVLVGLSCIYRNENLRPVSRRSSDQF